MVTLKALLLILMFEEGFSPTVYQDHLGHNTIGYGLRWYPGQKALYSEAEASKALLEEIVRVTTHVSENSLVEPVWSSTDDRGRMVLTLMAYQLGVTGLSRFKRFLGALKEGDIDKAQLELFDSRWARQTPARVARTVDLLTTDYRTVYRGKI